MFYTKIFLQKFLPPFISFFGVLIREFGKGKNKQYSEGLTGADNLAIALTPHCTVSYLN